MKNIFFFIIIFLCSISCNNKTKFKGENQANTGTIKPLLISTLDSMQGTWISNQDTEFKIVITINKLYSYYDNICIDTANILLADECMGDEIKFYNKSQVNGKYYIHYTEGSKFKNFCYKIGYLSNISFETFYDGKFSSFNKQ